MSLNRVYQRSQIGGLQTTRLYSEFKKWLEIQKSNYITGEKFIVLFNFINLSNKVFILCFVRAECEGGLHECKKRDKMIEHLSIWCKNENFCWLTILFTASTENMVSTIAWSIVKYYKSYKWNFTFLECLRHLIKKWDPRYPLSSYWNDMYVTVNIHITHSNKLFFYKQNNLKFPEFLSDDKWLD